MRIAVVGAGTAGAAAALFLSRAGHQVTLFEAVDDPKPVGAGIMIQPSGMYVLHRLGLLEPIVARGSRVERLVCVTTGGKSVLDLAYSDLDNRAFGIGLHRGVLFNALVGAVRRQSGIELRCGATVEGWEQEGDVSWLRLGRRARVGPFDLVVVADGARSRLRASASIVRRASDYPWGALWFIAEDVEGAFASSLFQVVESTREMLGFLPSGLGPTGNTPKVSLFWSIRADKEKEWRAEELESWKRRVREMEPRAGPVLEQIEGEQQVLFGRYYDVVMSPWHIDGIVFLGDAAHATSPQLGQGANLALFDALALSRALETSASIAEALAGYSRARRHHLAYYQWASRWLTPFFQSDQTWLGKLRDQTMGYACRLPYVRSRMLRTMCGLDQGALVSSPLSLLSSDFTDARPARV